MWKLLAVPLLAFAALPVFARDPQPGWIEVRSANFVVLTDSSEKQGRHIVGQFERMRSVFHTIFPKARVDFGAPIVVIAVKDRKDFQALEPQAYLAKGQVDLAGLFLHTPEKNYVLLRLDAQGEHPYATVYHEYTHLLLSDLAEWLPLWLNEGLAEFFQNSDIHEREVRLGEASPGDLNLLRESRLLPLSVLFKVDVSSPYYHQEEKGSIFYAQSWALTHLLEFADQVDHTHRIADYAELIREHADPVTAGERTFGDLLQLQKALSTYIQRGSFQYFTLAVPKEMDESSYKSRNVTQAEADTARADFLAFNGRAADARPLLEAVLRQDPDNLSAHETMGYLEFQAGKMDSARDWYAKAIQLDSQSYLAHYYFAAISMSGGTVPEHPEEVEDSLRTAIRLNPAFAPAYDELAQLYSIQHEKLDQAHRLNLRAAELDPGNLGYRLNTAAILQQEDHLTDALSVLRSAEKLAKTADDLSLVQGRIKTLEQYQAQKDQVAKAGSPEAGAPPAAVVQAPQPRHPDESADGPRHTAQGVIRNVQCTGATGIELKVEEAGKSVVLYSNNYYQLGFRAANYTPEGEIHPCTDLEGMKASIQYAESSDKTVNGQIVSVELSK
jgi:tetratricopeptide (TPR) repeat protein